MSNLFLQLLNMSITAGWLVMAVLVLRPFLRKAPKALLCALWVVVAIRLLCPFSIESAFSLLPSAKPIPHEILLSPAPQIDSGMPVIDGAINPILNESFTPVAGASVNPLQIVLAVAANVWLLGVAAMLIYAIISYIRVYHRVRIRMPLQDRVYVCDEIDTPFIFGIIRPQIYLPSSLSKDDCTYVLAHEQAHLKRFDHWWKPLGFALLSVYWFHPLMWVAYILLCRDIETACDEHVLRNMNKGDTAHYAEALLHCSSKRRFISACPLAFGETSVKSRIKHALSYKKPALWVMVLCVLSSVTLTACFLTDPLASNTNGAGSELDGVSLHVEELDLSDEQPHITVKWDNNSNYQLMYGESFRLYRYENGKLIDTVTIDNLAFNAVGYLLRPHTAVEKTYNLTHYDLSQDGLYRFESSVLIHGGESTSYTLWVNFEIHNGKMTVPVIAMSPNANTCQHQWIDASCTVSKTCMICQAIEGEPLGHDWADATCEAPQTCQRCALTDGKSLGHDFEGVTCTDAGACSRCQTKGTDKAPHTYSDATCTDDEICTACGAHGKKALGHAHAEATCTADGICSRCGDIGSYAHGHDFQGATCTEGGTCVYCGEIGEATGHRQILPITCKGTLCGYCGEYFGPAGSHFYLPNGRCEACGHYDPDEVLWINTMSSPPPTSSGNGDFLDTVPDSPYSGLQPGEPIYWDPPSPVPHPRPENPPWE